jgi:hypothetical protein
MRYDAGAFMPVASEVVGGGVEGGYLTLKFQKMFF